MDTVIFLSGQTRGATLEGIGRSLCKAFARLDIAYIEISLLDHAAFLETIKTIDFRKVLLVFSFVSMGMEIPLRREDGSVFDLWQEAGVPFFSFHGDSPAYFFDRHIVKGTRFVSTYIFPEHQVLRSRLPQILGPLETTWLIPLDQVPKEEIDFRLKRQSGKLIFLKNGKDPAQLRRHWQTSLEPRLLLAMQEMASELENDLDGSIANQIDDLVVRYFTECGFDISLLTKLRLFFIAQLDDYLRAVKCTRMASVLMDYPVEIRGNNWGHLDFTGKQARYIDECDFTRSTQLIRESFGIIDMSPNTASQPHDRIMRAYGAHTACLTNRQKFLEELPHQQQLSFAFEKNDLQHKIEYLLSHRAETVDAGIEVAARYNQLHPEEAAVRKLLDCASLVRFDNLRQRPAGSQDYFVWSQRLA